jgi:hypothetical protein
MLLFWRFSCFILGILLFINLHQRINYVFVHLLVGNCSSASKQFFKTEAHRMISIAGDVRILVLLSLIATIRLLKVNF